MIALDADLLAYAVNRYAPEHARAAAVVEHLVNGDRPWALPWPAIHRALDVLTHPHATVRPLRPSEAWGFLGLVASSATVRLLGPTERHAQALVEVLGGVAGEHGLPPGLETAVVLREHGIRELLTTDPGMRRYAFLTVIDPVHAPGWTPGMPPPRRYRVLRGR
ncbi:MAG TPA: hypothetical protein VI792_09500 [Candidatus Eisenbacteria bacterium]